MANTAKNISMLGPFYFFGGIPFLRNSSAAEIGNNAGSDYNGRNVHGVLKSKKAY
jgi:hypothetical protein